MKKCITFLILINIKFISSFISKNNSDIITIKFKTYYPYVEKDPWTLNAEEYYRKIHSSKIYLEIQTGDETTFKKGNNQIPNTIINLQEKVWVTTDM